MQINRLTTDKVSGVMSDKVLIYIEDRVIKGIVLKVLRDRNLEFLEGLDVNDLQLKLDIFQDMILFHIVQITKTNYQNQFEYVKRVKAQTTSGFPVLAIIPDDSRDFVGGAKNANIEDVVLIPGKREQFREVFSTRLTEFIKTIPGRVNQDEVPPKNEGETNLVADEAMKQEIKRAIRGKYSVSFVMGRFTGVHIGQIHDFYASLKKEMRDTDRIMIHDYHTFIVVCPFTVKSYLVEVEKKIREAFEAMFGYSRIRRLDMYGTTYPDDGKNIDDLIAIMEKGVHDSAVISNIREPLKTISRERLEEYRKMLKLYK